MLAEVLLQQKPHFNRFNKWNTLGQTENWQFVSTDK